MGGGFIVLRLVHVTLGVFWAGGVMFMNFIVGPALGATGPDGMKVMAELNRRRYFDIMLAVGAVTILSGLDLLRRDSDNFTIRSPMIMGLMTGMAAAIIAWVLALLAIRPAIKRMGAIGAQMVQAASEARAGLLAQLTASRGRLVAFGSVATLFLLIAVMSMAVARYL